MTISRSLTISASVLIVSLTASQLVFQWSASTRADRVRALDLARADHAVLAELRHDLNEVAYELDRGALATALSVSVTRDSVTRRRADITADLQRLDAAGDIARHIDVSTLSDSIVGMFQDWDAFTAEAAASPATASEHIQRARSASERMVNGDLPRLMQAAERAVTDARAGLQTTEQQTTTVSWAVFAGTLLLGLVILLLAHRGPVDPPRPHVEPPALVPSAAAPAGGGPEPAPVTQRLIVPAAEPVIRRAIVPDPEPAPAAPEPPPAPPAQTPRRQAAAPASAPWRDVQKMQAIGRLAGGVAHDFNNLLTIIKGHTERLMELSSSPQIRERLDEVQRAADRAASLTAQLLAFSRRQVLAPRIINLNNVVNDMQPLVRPLLGDRIRLELELERSLWPVRADPGQLAQAIMNLVVNARDAMPDGGVVRIRTANIAHGDPQGQETALAATPLVALSVIDNGLGMDEATKAQMFEPFFTTKGIGQGTGLGLSTAYGIVGQSGGDILVNTAPGKGTALTILLPRVVDEPEFGRGEDDRRMKSGEMPGIRPW